MTKTLTELRFALPNIKTGKVLLKNRVKPDA